LKRLGKKLAFIGVATLFCAVLAGCGATDATVEQKDQAIAVSVVSAALQDIQTTAMIKGTIAGQTEVTIIPKIAGVVETVEVAVGDTVKENQVLFTLQTKELRAQLAQAQAAYKMSKSAYDDAVRTYERMKTLYDEGAISLSQLEQAQLGVNASSTESAAAAVQLLQLQLDNAVIKSPIDGIVASLNVTVGEIASQQVASAVVVNIDKVKLDAEVSEANVNKVTPGQEVKVVVAAAGTEAFSGVITTVAPAASALSKAYPVTITIDNPERLLKSGMFAEADISTEKRAQVLAVPQSALVSGEETAVYIIKDEKAHLAKITPGLENEEWLEVIDGISLGDQVVTRGQHLLYEGASVTVAEGQ